MPKFASRFAIALLAGTLLTPPLVWAQDNDASPPAANDQMTEGQDPPSRVGSLSFIEGDVSQYAGDQDDWAPAQLNFPVTGNSAFATGANGRAEFDLGDVTARIGNGSELDIVTLDEESTDLRLPQGMVSIGLPKPDADDTPSATVVTTPRGDVALTAPGRYLIDAGTADQPTIVTVYAGQAQITDAAGTIDNVAAGQAGVLSGDSNHPVFASRAAQQNPLETWTAQREQQTVAAATAPLPPQVSRQMTGVATLASYGGWQTEPQYGPVWTPRNLPPDWEPYRDGHWAYVRPWGWTWVDNARWGFAPFHYGRWIRVRNSWAWAPGAVVVQPGVRVVARPVYSPALVVFAGTSAGVRGAPGVAWYPLGWNEPYIPAYRVSRTYIERVNVRVVERTRIVEVTNVYPRLYVRGGNFDPYAQVKVGIYRDRAIAVPRTAFETARPVAAVAIRPTAQQLRPVVRLTQVEVKAPPARPRPALRTAEPPKPKILPVAKRAPIPQKLMEPKANPALRPRPAGATVRPPTPARPGEVKPEAKPAVVAPPSANQRQVKPEAKPAVALPPKERPGQARPEAKPVVTPPRERPGQAKPDANAKPAVVAPPKETLATPAKPEGKPPAAPVLPARPERIKPEGKSPVTAPAKEPNALVRPEAKPVSAPGVRERPERARPEAKPAPSAKGPPSNPPPQAPTPTAMPRPERLSPAAKQEVRPAARPERNPEAKPVARPAGQGAKPDGKGTDRKDDKPRP